MSSSLSFTSSGAFLEAKYKQRNSLEIPQHILPSKVHLVAGDVSTPDVLISRDNDHEPNLSCTLRQVAGQVEASSLVLDFGFAVAGIPVIRVAAIQHTSLPVLLDISYSEGFPGIERHGGDGPFPFSAGADTQRRNRFRIRGPGFYEAKHVQGSQRWMRITLVSKEPCSVSLSLAAFKPTTENTPLDQLPGYFACSDNQLTELWAYGARTLQLNCIPARTVPPPWQISEDMGILVDSQRCNSYGWGGEWTDYEAEFEGMVVDGGLCWAVRMRPIGGLLFVLNVDPHGNSTTLELWFGLYNKPQKTLVPLLLESKDLTGLGIVSNKWYNFRCVCIGTEEYKVYIDGELVATFKKAGPDAPGKPVFARITHSGLLMNIEPTSASEAPAGFPTIPQGSVGFGAGEDQICRFRNLTVKSAVSNEILYTSGLNNPSVLGDFGINWNQLPYIFDGAKRDRYAWTADIITGGPSLYYSTAGLEYIRGNIEASMMRSTAWNGAKGLLPGGNPPGREFERNPKDTMFKVLSINYSFYLIMVIHDFWLYTGDNLLIYTYWEQIKGCLAFMEDLVNDVGLITAEAMAGMYHFFTIYETELTDVYSYGLRLLQRSAIWSCYKAEYLVRYHSQEVCHNGPVPSHKRPRNRPALSLSSESNCRIHKQTFVQPREGSLHYNSRPATRLPAGNSRLATHHRRCTRVYTGVFAPETKCSLHRHAQQITHTIFPRHSRCPTDHFPNHLHIPYSRLPSGRRRRLSRACAPQCLGSDLRRLLASLHGHDVGIPAS